MTAYLFVTAGLLLILQFLLLLPETDAVYYSYYFYSSSYTSSRYYYVAPTYPYVYICSIGCLAGAIVGGLVFIGGIIGLIVFLCCLCKAAKVRRVEPTAVAVGTAAVVTMGASYPRQQHHLQPQPPPYDQNTMYPPNPPQGEQQAYPPNVAMPDTAYPPPPPYQTTENAETKF